jgi:hypothetical protein
LRAPHNQTRLLASNGDLAAQQISLRQKTHWRFLARNPPTFAGIRISAVGLSPWIPSQIGANVSVRREC